MKKLPEKLTLELVQKYLKKYNKNEQYQNEEKALINLLKKIPKNKNLPDIILKVVIVNALYHTTILHPYRMAENIQKQNIDSDLKKGLSSVIERISNIEGQKRRFYSFATKYCSRHNKASYPIYDKYVHKMLWAYREKDKFYKFEENALRNYEELRNILKEFRKHYNLEKFSFEEIDKFLWTYGRELFPEKY
jgi:hypothetical protein